MQTPRLEFSSLVAGLVALLALFASGCADPVAEGLVRIGDIQNPARPHFHDFGEVPPGATLEKVFTYENREGRPVRILKVDSSCICTVPSLRAIVREGGEERTIKGDPYDPVEKLVVPAGALAEVTLRVDPSAVKEPNVDKLVTIRVTTDSPNSAYLKMEAHLVVREYFQVAPSTADFGRVALSDGASMELAIVNYDESGRTVGEVLEAPEGIRAQVIPHPTSDKPAWLVDVRVDAGREPSVLSGELTVGTRLADGSAASPLTIPVRALIVPDIAVTPPQISLRTEADGVGHSVDVVARSSSRLFRVVEARVTGDLSRHLTVSAEPVEPSPEGSAQRWTVRVSGATLGDTQTLLSGAVVLDLDDPDVSRLEVPISTVNLR